VTLLEPGHEAARRGHDPPPREPLDLLEDVPDGPAGTDGEAGLDRDLAVGRHRAGGDGGHGRHHPLAKAVSAPRGHGAAA
jgi:hypothetical protein